MNFFNSNHTNSLKLNDNDETGISLFVFSVFSTTVHAQLAPGETDYEALKALYNATDGSNWTNNSGWDFSGSVSVDGSWYGITVSGGRIRNIYLQDNNLVRNIPTEIENFTNLITLNLRDNQLSDSIPTEIGNLTHLQELNLSNNKLAGEVPKAFTKLPALNKLNLGNNNLNTLPILTNPKLSELQVHGNLLTFKDLVPNNHKNLSFYNYENQRVAQEIDALWVVEGEVSEFQIPDNHLEDDNTYEWKQIGTGQTLQNSSNPNYQIDNVTAQNTDDYQCIIRNDTLGDLALTLNYVLNVLPIKPTITQPKPYCLSDISATLISEGTNAENTIWYAYETLTDFLGKGKKIEIKVDTHRTVYAIIFDNSNRSEAVAIPIFRRPALTNQGSVLSVIGQEIEGLAYQWYKNGIKMPETTHEFDTKGKTGQYRINVLTPEGCPATSMTYVFANGSLETVTDSEQITSINQDAQTEITIYPNPFQGQIEILLNQYYDAMNVKIISIDGQVHVQKTVSGGNKFILDVPYLSKGIYFLHIQTNQETLIHKILKE